MTDLQALYHNPEAFSDADLKLVKKKLTMQRYTPWLTGIGFGGSAYVLEMAIFKRRAANPYLLGAATVVGFAIGGAAAYKIAPKNLSAYSADAQEAMDPEIIQAFEKRQVTTAMNASGYGNNSLTLADDSQKKSAQFRKPY